MRLLVAALISPLLVQAAGASEPQIRVHAYPETQVARSGDEIFIHLDQTNLSESDVHLPQENGSSKRAELDYIIRIHDENGHKPSLTQQGERVFHPTQPQFGSVQVHIVKPGQTSTEVFPLSSLYILGANNTYRASLEFKKPIRNVTTPIRSNWVTISVK